MTANLDQFALELDTLLGLHPGPDPASDATALHAATLLIGMNLDAGAAPRPELRARWISHTRTLNPQRSPRSLFAAKWAWAAALLLVLALLIAFRQPVFAAVGRLFGYIYIQDSGFLPADSTLVLAQPVVQSHDGRSLLALRGVSTPRETTLILEYSDIVFPADGAQLETATGEVIPLSGWEYSPNEPDSHGVRLFFPTLPEGVTQTTLVLPAGWRLPLAWIPASQSGLPDVQVIPYPEANAEMPSPADTCAEKNGMELCVLAATTSSESTSILVEAQSTQPDLQPGDIWQGLVWQTETEQVTLRDAQGNTFPMEGPPVSTLAFPPLPGGQQATLTVPALLASVSIPEQTIVVDMGPDPQPDTVIPLDVSIQVLDMTVHFSQAAFTGDGVNSLRLTLNADPVQTVNGLTPVMLEMGKPPQVDDLFGSGNLAGSKDLFVELIRPQGKITGVLELPIVNATVAVSGPFEFSFTLPDAISTTATPVVADPNTFSPAPTPTSLSLDRYAYSGQALLSGDLLFTVINGDNSDVYAFRPGVDSQPRLFVTLPGAVAQVYVHPDRQGLDYLAGISKVQDDINYIDDISLYTLRFDERLPRLLFRFASNVANLVGTTVEGNWSYDGRYALFRIFGSEPGSTSWRYIWLDLSCRESGICELYEIPLEPSLELFKAYFAPNDFRILFTGSDYSGTGKQDIFLLDFSPDHPERQPINLTANVGVGNGITAATWVTDGKKTFTVCSKTMDREATVFCWLDPVTSQLTFLDGLKPPFDGWRLFGRYWLSPTGDQLAAILFPENATRSDTLPELRLLDLNGQTVATLTSAESVDNVSFSQSGQYLAYTFFENDQKLEVFDLAQKLRFRVYSNPTNYAVTFLGWVR